MSLDETYVSLFCRLQLAKYDDNYYYEDLEDLREKAANLDVRGSPKFFLPLTSESLLKEYFGNRKPLDPTFKVKDRPAITTRVHYSSSFKVH